MRKRGNRALAWLAATVVIAAGGVAAATAGGTGPAGR